MKITSCLIIIILIQVFGERFEFLQSFFFELWRNWCSINFRFSSIQLLKKYKKFKNYFQNASAISNLQAEFTFYVKNPSKASTRNRVNINNYLEKITQIFSKKLIYVLPFTQYHENFIILNRIKKWRIFMFLLFYARFWNFKYLIWEKNLNMRNIYCITLSYWPSHEFKSSWYSLWSIMWSLIFWGASGL